MVCLRESYASRVLTLLSHSSLCLLILRAVDASSVKHQNDTRCANCQFQNGVGSGFVRLFVDKTNTVAAFQFSATAGLHTAQFAIGRPLSF